MTMEPKTDILIAGAGLAGLTAAIHLSKLGFQVTLIEKNTYPHHKVCGEYVSNEVLPYLEWLGIDLSGFAPTQLQQLQFSAANGNDIRTVLPAGGFGISRYALDQYLYETAISKGCHVITDAVTDISFQEDTFKVKLLSKKSLSARVAIAAYGKRDALDQKFSRSFIRKKSPWLAVKAHYEGEFPDDLVALHNFEGGYCGVSKVEDNRINICYLVDYTSFKKYKNIPEHRTQVLYQNKYLKQLFENTKMLFEQPISISQISFEQKANIENHVLMIGDTAGLIHPLCGNGMAMAIHSAKICAGLVADYMDGRITSRQQLEENYTRLWRRNFRKRMFTGKIIAKLLRNEKLSDVMMRILIKFPSLLPMLIKQTHGKPLMNKQW